MNRLIENISSRNPLLVREVAFKHFCPATQVENLQAVSHDFKYETFTAFKGITAKSLLHSKSLKSPQKPL